METLLWIESLLWTESLLWMEPLLMASWSESVSRHITADVSQRHAQPVYVHNAIFFQ